MQTILFQGDSITDGGRWREIDTFLGDGYPTLVAGELGILYPNQYEFHNRGISGNRSVDLFARMKMDILNCKPDYLSILIGVNDVAGEFEHANGVSAQKYFAVYDMMIAEITETLPNTGILIMEPFVLKGSVTEARYEEYRYEVGERAAKAKEIAEKYSVCFVALQDKFDEAVKVAPDEYWIRDGVHPTAAGHELIKRTWIKSFNILKNIE